MVETLLTIARPFIVKRETGKDGGQTDTFPETPRGIPLGFGGAV
jgi:hypothetical protein